MSSVTIITNDKGNCTTGRPLRILQDEPEIGGVLEIHSNV